MFPCGTGKLRKRITRTVARPVIGRFISESNSALVRCSKRRSVLLTEYPSPRDTFRESPADRGRSGCCHSPNPEHKEISNFLRSNGRQNARSHESVEEPAVLKRNEVAANDLGDSLNSSATNALNDCDVYCVRDWNRDTSRHSHLAQR